MKRQRRERGRADGYIGGLVNGETAGRARAGVESIQSIEPPARVCVSVQAPLFAFTACPGAPSLSIGPGATQNTATDEPEINALAC